MKTNRYIIYAAILFLTQTITGSSLPKLPSEPKDTKTITVWFYKNGFIYSRCDNKQQAERFKKENDNNGEVITKEYILNPEA